MATVQEQLLFKGAACILMITVAKLAHAVPVVMK